MNKIILYLILSVVVATHSFAQTSEKQEQRERFKHDYPGQMDIQGNDNSEGRFQQNEWAQLSDSSISESDGNVTILNYLNVQSIQETKLTIDTTAVLQTDSIKNVTDKQDKQKSEFGATEKTAAIIVGAVAGLVIGGAVGDALTTDRSTSDIMNFDGGAILGGCLGLILGPFINYHVMEHLAEKSAQKEQSDEQKSKNSKVTKTVHE